MTEYIEREALVNSFRSCGASKDLIDSIVYRINLQEAVDAVPVVRCKDCKYFKTRLCENEDNYDDWFCADGERKDGDGNGRVHREVVCCEQVD